MRVTWFRWWVVFFVLAGALEAGAIEPLSGRALFAVHCSSCHGFEGRGDGPIAALFGKPPRDLLAEFPAGAPTDALVKRVLDGQPLVLELDEKALRETSRQVDEIAAHLRRLAAADWPQVEYGWATYADRCAVCHGPYGRPTGTLDSGVKPPRDLSSPAFQRSVDEPSLVEAVRHGRRGMPALVPRLGLDEAQAVASFARMLSPGFEAYSNMCAPCHGDDGVGVGNFDQTVQAPAFVFDAKFMKSRSDEDLRQSIQHMLRSKAPAMPHFREALNAEEARRIILYLQARAEGYRRAAEYLEDKSK